MLVHDRATPLARHRTPEGFLEMRARIGLDVRLPRGMSYNDGI